MRVQGGVGGGRGCRVEGLFGQGSTVMRVARAGESYANTQHVAASVGLSPTCTECTHPYSAKSSSLNVVPFKISDHKI